jgi:cell division protein ZapE
MSENLISRYEMRVGSGALKADPAQAEAARKLDRLFVDLVRGGKRSFPFFGKAETPCGIYFYGGVGRGKSMLMDLFMESLPSRISAQRVHFHEFMVGVHDKLHKARQNGHDVNNALPRLAKEIVGQTSVLCFDEFHVTDIADAMILSRLFTALFAEDCVVVATSNWAPERLYEGGLQRDLFLPFIALLKQKVEIVHLDSPHDYRTQFLTQEGTYFTPLGAGADAHADKLFEDLVGGAAVHEDVIEVKGRSIEVAKVSGGIARFSFPQLCEQPHGAEDFLAIAARYHTVFIERVPKMGYDRRNEAKRFMLLIDALYEARTRVVFTADAVPERLYFGDDHAYEFTRTVSRLNEMQSADYLGK